MRNIARKMSTTADPITSHFINVRNPFQVLTCSEMSIEPWSDPCSVFPVMRTPKGSIPKRRDYSKAESGSNLRKRT